MSKVVFVFMLAVLPEAVFSQVTKAPTPYATTKSEPETVTKVVHVHQGMARKIANLLPSFGFSSVNTGSDDMLGVIVLNGPAEKVASIEKVIKELDVTPPVSTGSDVEVVVYLVGASNGPMQESSKNPPAIEPVIKQLGSIFPYKSYRLVGTILLRSQQGKGAENAGILNYNFNSELPRHPSRYTSSYKSANASSIGSKATIHLNEFDFGTSIPMQIGSTPNTSQYQYFDIRTKSDIDVREGQKVVVGKADVANEGSAIFVVLTAKLVD